MRIDTKANRVEVQNQIFARLISEGYQREDYKQLIIFIKDDIERNRFLFAVYKGTSTNALEHKYAGSAERRAQRIQQFKEGHDRTIQYKTEQKEKNKGKKSGHAGAAASIKEELTKAFPGIKFSCTSDSFSMGDSVDVRWTDGATSEQVKAISGKYQRGHFNSMEDMYEYSNSREDIPQAKYVSEGRKMSEQTEAVRAEFIEKYEGESHGHWSAEQVFYRVFAKTSIPAGAKVTGIVRSECSETDYYSFVLDLSEAKEVVTPAQNEKPAHQEVESGTVQVIEYGDKAIAVIGDTKPIKDKLKALGGRFNFRLTCGAGWIFPKTKLAEIAAALSKGEQVKEELNTEIQKTIEFFKESDITIHGEVQESTKEIELKYPKMEVEIFDNLKDIEAAAQNGQMISLCNLSDLVNKRKQA